MIPRMSKRRHQGYQMAPNGDPAKPKLKEFPKRRGPAAEGVACKINFKISKICLFATSFFCEEDKFDSIVSFILLRIHKMLPD